MNNAAKQFANDRIERLFDTPNRLANSIARDHSAQLYALLIEAFEAGQAHESNETLRGNHVSKHAR